MKIQDESYAVDRCRSSLKWEDTSADNGDGAGYFTGTITTPDGMVDAYSQRGAGRDYSVIWFAYRGRQYRRCFTGKFYSARGLATIAGRFTFAIVRSVK